MVDPKEIIDPYLDPLHARSRELTDWVKSSSKQEWVAVADTSTGITFAIFQSSAWNVYHNP